MRDLDVVIIGSGPVGLFASFYTSSLKMKTINIDVQDQHGGQCTALYPKKSIYDIPGYEKISGDDLSHNLLAQAKKSGGQFLYNTKVSKLEFEDGKFKCYVESDIVATSKCVFLCTGAGLISPRKLDLSLSAEPCEGKSLFYSVKNPEFFSGKDIAIFGGGDSACDWAIELSKYTNYIYLIQRSSKMRCMPSTQDKILNLHRNKKISLIQEHSISKINHKNGFVENIDLIDISSSFKEGRVLNIKCNYVLPFFGLASNGLDLGLDGLNMSSKGISVVPNTLQTNIPGVYAMGDCAFYPNKKKIIAIGFSECILASYHAYENCVFNRRASFVHSSSNPMFKK